MAVTAIFQSTHPARGATCLSRFKRICISYFNPRTPRGVRRQSRLFRPGGWDFNPRTPRGVRLHHKVDGLYDIEFQSTHPARGATGASNPNHITLAISIHAPREGCDQLVRNTQQVVCDFNPRTPRGVRRQRLPRRRGGFEFQSTHPARGATVVHHVHDEGQLISIHAPREGCDSFPTWTTSQPQNFNPRTPRGVRHSPSHHFPITRKFQSTHPARGATWRD